MDDHIQIPQRILHRVAHRLVDGFLVGKTDVHLGRMDIDVHDRTVDRKHQTGKRVLVIHELGAVPVFDRLLQDAALQVAPVDIIILEIAVAPGQGGFPDQARDPDRPVSAFRLHGFPHDLPAVDLADHVGEAAVSGSRKPRPPVHDKIERDLRIRQGQLLHICPHMRTLGERRLQELGPGRRIIKQVSHDDRRSVRSPDLFAELLSPAFDQISHRAQFVRLFRDHLDAADRRYAGQSFTPEAQGRKGA